MKNQYFKLLYVFCVLICTGKAYAGAFYRASTDSVYFTSISTVSFVRNPYNFPGKINDDLTIIGSGVVDFQTWDGTKFVPHKGEYANLSVTLLSHSRPNPKRGQNNRLVDCAAMATKFKASPPAHSAYLIANLFDWITVYGDETEDSLHLVIDRQRGGTNGYDGLLCGPSNFR